jgi:hypothetical protein
LFAIAAGEACLENCFMTVGSFANVQLGIAKGIPPWGETRQRISDSNFPLKNRRARTRDRACVMIAAVGERVTTEVQEQGGDWDVGFHRADDEELC